MTPYTTLSFTEIQEVAKRYGILDLLEAKVLKGGSQNTNYLLSAMNGKFVLTICEQKTVEETQELALFLEYLATNNFPSSKIIRPIDSKTVGLWKTKPILLKKFIDGKILEDIPPHLLQMIGKSLGQLHQIEAPKYLPKELVYGIEHFHEVAMYDEHSPFHLWLQKKEDYIKPYFLPDLPKALIHSDVFHDNIIVSEDESTITIMDFEEASYYYRVFDIGMTIVGLCREGKTINLQKAAHLIEGYKGEIELMAIEWGSLKAFVVYAAAAMCFWRHKHFNYTHPIEELKDHYLALKAIADHVYDLPEDCFLNL